MNRLILLLIGLVSSLAVIQAQDFVVTIHRDTLNCQLGRLKNDVYPIKFLLDDEVFEGTIHKDTIMFFRRNVFRDMYSNRLRSWYPHVDLGFDAGAAHQVGPFRTDLLKAPNSRTDRSDWSDFKFRTGLSLGTNITYYFSKTIGYGLKYNYRSLLGGDVQYQYVGPTMAFRFWNENRRDHIFLAFSAGYGRVRQKEAPVQIELVTRYMEMTANCLAGDVSVGYKHRFSRSISAYVKLSGTVGYPGFVRVMEISKYVQGSDKPLVLGTYCHNINAIQLTAGFSFHR